HEGKDLELALAFYEYAADTRLKLVDLAPRRDEAERKREESRKDVQRVRSKLDPQRLATLTGLWWRTRVTTVVDEFTASHPASRGEDRICWNNVLSAVEEILTPATTASVR